MSRYATSEAARAANAQFEAAMQREVDAMWAARAAGEAPELFDHRKGTIRGILAVLALVALVPFVVAALR